MELFEKYAKLTKKALKEAAKNSIKGGMLKGAANYFLKMAQAYVNDAYYFLQQGDKERCLAAIAYAHGWLDAGASLGLFQVKDSNLFTVDGEIYGDDKRKENNS